MRWLKRIAIVTAGLMALVLAAAAWLLSTQSGARLTAAIASSVLAGRLEIGAVEGTLAGPLALTDVRYRDPAAGLDITVRRAALDMELSELSISLLFLADQCLQ